MITSVVDFRPSNPLSDMGNCCLKPCSASLVTRYRNRKMKNKVRPKLGAFSALYTAMTSNGSGLMKQKLQVLKDPTGRDISEKYELGQELGRGEFGVTYLCTETETGEKFACKSISKKKLKMAVDVEDVRREVEIMRRLPKHPNVVSLKDTYEDDSAVHIVMELCEGGELFDRIVARGHYTERAAANVLRTVVEVIQVG